MDNTAQIPLTGGMLTGAMIAEQWLLLLICVVAVAAMITIVRITWRRDKKLNDL